MVDTKPVVKVRKSITDEVRRLNAEAGLANPIRLGAVALPLSNLDETSALRILSGVSKQGSRIADPTDWIRKMAEAWGRKPPEFSPRPTSVQAPSQSPRPPSVQAPSQSPRPPSAPPPRGVLGFRDAMPKANRREHSLLVPKAKASAGPTPPPYAPPGRSSSSSSMMALPARSSASSSTSRPSAPFNAFASQSASPTMPRSFSPIVPKVSPPVPKAFTSRVPDAPRHRAAPSSMKKDGGLPILEHLPAVVDALCGDVPVCCIQGETGCGKSTQIPQIILQQAERLGQQCCVAVTQPRRVAALNLANRVAKELGEDGPGNAVGYRIGGESRPGQNIDFCTTGYLLQLLINAPREIERYTHLVLDEVHDRTADSDMLCLVVRLLVQATFHASPSGNCVRLVIMSATLQSQLFSTYFSVLSTLVGPSRQPPTVFVGTRCFPVQEYFLDDLQQSFRISNGWEVNKRIQEEAKCDKKGGSRVEPRHTEKFHQIIVDLLRCIGKGGSTILVFLPGIAEISALWEDARCLEQNRAFRVILLHSMIPREDQEEAFKEPPFNVTHVVLATDIAESSITLPHVTAVIDLGLHRRVDYDDRRGMACLATKWVSQAAAKQRSGRAGRTQPGICIRLYSRHLHDDCFESHEPPEAASMPLDRLYLQAKQLAACLTSTLGDWSPKCAQDVLLQMIQPPNISKIDAARRKLAELGAITVPQESATITPLGRLCLQLPIDLRLTRLVWLGSLWGNPADAIVMAACLGSAEPFSSPSLLFIKSEQDFVERLHRSVACRLLFDGGVYSEPLMLRQVFLEWLTRFQESGQKSAFEGTVNEAQQRSVENFSWEFALARGRMGHLVSTVVDLTLRTLRTCQEGGEIFTSLQGLINCMGYSFNARGDLSKLFFDEWRTSDVWKVFDAKPSILKSLLASAFSDNVMMGGYANTMLGNQSKNKDDGPEAILKEIETHNMPLDRTAIFRKPGERFDPDHYVNFVCGSRARVRLNRRKINDSAELVEIASTSKATRQHLSSRAEEPDQVGLPMQFNLLHQFALSMKDVMRPGSKDTQDWTFPQSYEIDHPHVIHWELINPVEGKRGKARTPVAMPDRRNALGFMARLPDSSSSASGLPPIAAIGVSASIQGSGQPNKCFLAGATVLPASYIGFVLATAKCEEGDGQCMQQLGMTTGGAISLMHHLVTFPKEVTNSNYWELIRRLRNGIREEIERVDEEYDNPDIRMPLFADSVLRDFVWDLLDESDAIRDKEALRAYPKSEASSRVVSLLESSREEGRVHALQPLVTWEELEKRQRETLIKKIVQQPKVAAQAASEAFMSRISAIAEIPLSASAAELKKHIDRLTVISGGAVGHPAIMMEVIALKAKYGLKIGEKGLIIKVTPERKKLKKKKVKVQPGLLMLRGGEQLSVDGYGKAFVLALCEKSSTKNFYEDLAKARQLKHGQKPDSSTPPPTAQCTAPKPAPPMPQVASGFDAIYNICQAFVGKVSLTVMAASDKGAAGRALHAIDAAMKFPGGTNNQKIQLKKFSKRICKAIKEIRASAPPQKPFLQKQSPVFEAKLLDSLGKLERLLGISSSDFLTSGAVSGASSSQASATAAQENARKRKLEGSEGGQSLKMSKKQKKKLTKQEKKENRWYGCPGCSLLFKKWGHALEHFRITGHADKTANLHKCAEIGTRNFLAQKNSGLPSGVQEDVDDDESDFDDLVRFHEDAARQEAQEAEEALLIREVVENAEVMQDEEEMDRAREDEEMQEPEEEFPEECADEQNGEPNAEVLTPNGEDEEEAEDDDAEDDNEMGDAQADGVICIDDDPEAEENDLLADPYGDDPSMDLGL